jgi:hypothetical protein
MKRLEKRVKIRSGKGRTFTSRRYRKDEEYKKIQHHMLTVFTLLDIIQSFQLEMAASAGGIYEHSEADISDAPQIPAFADGFGFADGLSLYGKLAIASQEERYRRGRAVL